MAGYAKREFDNYIQQQKSKFYKIIKTNIIPVLPIEYNFDMIFSILNKYYMFELRAFQFQLDGYSRQDRTLYRCYGKTRYQVKSLDYYLNDRPITNLLSHTYIANRATKFDKSSQISSESEFIRSRNNAISRMQEKVDTAKLKAQETEPVFLDKMMGLYDRKRTSQRDRVYILHELYKYDCLKVTAFLQRLLSHEQNFQLREMVHKHLQDYGYEPKLRRKESIPIHTNNSIRKKAILEFRELRFNIEGIPAELSYLIENSKTQSIKSYDYFISHSYKDHNEIQKLIVSLNKIGKNVYCDWISDSDYLRRELVCDATLEVITHRIEESDAILFVDSEFSRSSQWVAYELQYAEQKNKPIKYLSINKASEHIEKIKCLDDKWYNSVVIRKMV